MIFIPKMPLTRNLIFSMLAMTSLASAQRWERCILSNEEAWPVGVETVASWCVADNGELSVVGSMTSARTLSGVALPGGLFVMSETDALICGRNALGVGLLGHWSFDSDAGTLQLQSSYSSSSMDFAGVIYDAPSEQVYLLDCTGARIVNGTWNDLFPWEGWY